MKNPKYYGHQSGLAPMVHTFFDKKTSGGAIKNKIMSHEEIAEESHKQIIRKFEKRKEQFFFIGNIWGCWSCWYVVDK